MTDDKIIVFFYVDDLGVLYRHGLEEDFLRFDQDLKETYQVKDLGEINWFLFGIRVTRDRDQGKLWLSQDSYITKIVAKCGLADITKGPTAPLTTEPLEPYDGELCQKRIDWHGFLIGSILYAAMITRIDIIYAASRLSQFLKKSIATAYRAGSGLHQVSDPA